MPRPISEMSDRQIGNEIVNHERAGKTSLPRYYELLEARGQRSGFRFEVSLAAITRAARERRFISYGELAAASGVDWSRAYRLLGGHLWDLVKWSYAKDGILLSAIVVNKQHVETGEMAKDTLSGFLKAAEELGISYSDPLAFLREQQTRVFEFFAAPA